MKDQINLKQRTTNEFFGKSFSKLYKEWSGKTGGNQQDFAEACGLQNKNSVSNWATGKQIPKDKTVLEMIRVFNDAGMDVTVYDFLPIDGKDFILHDPQALKLLQKLNLEFAKEIGLSEDFLNFLFKCTGFNDSDEGYPAWSFTHSRLVHSFTTQEKELKHLEGFDIQEFYHFPMLETRAVTDDNYAFTTKNANGNSTMTQTIDLRILKDLQDEIIDIIKYFYFKRRKLLKEQEIEMTKLANPIIQKDGHPPFIGTHEFTKEELIRIDPYKQYLDWKEEKE